MKKYNSIIHSFGHLAVLALFASPMLTSCTDDDYITYSSDENGIYFNHDTLVFSFSVLPVDTLTHVINVPVKVMGTLSDQPRTFAYSVERQMPNDSLQKLIYMPEHDQFVWAEEGAQYTVPAEVVIPAGQTEGVIPITIYRSRLEGNYSEGYKHYRLVIRLAENQNFTPTLSESDQIRIVEFDNAIDQPAWYDAYGDKVWYKPELGEWHPYKLIKLVEYFHDVKDVLPETYTKMVALYGENLENVPYGDFHVYRTIFRKYIYSRMYEHFNDPANRDMILSLYPDFIFDFPDPFAVEVAE
ncbi:MAG: DUF4843 domain-containing protein [Bacteroidaceae bacterium]|nr:DUF4843 domain-containing protein [Bacteroidaceae bacterium]